VKTKIGSIPPPNLSLFSVKKYPPKFGKNNMWEYPPLAPPILQVVQAAIVGPSVDAPDSGAFKM